MTRLTSLTTSSIFRLRRRRPRRRLGNRPYGLRSRSFRRRRRFRRNRRRHPRRTFHLRFRQVVTSDWPTAPTTTPSDGTSGKETPLQWNFDHMSFSLNHFLQIGHGTSSYQHQPPFRYYRFKKIVVKGTWINWTSQYFENVIGHTALDLDGEDKNRGNVNRSNLDPAEHAARLRSDPTKAPFNYDPLQDRTSARKFNIRRGFTRVLRPKLEITQQVQTPKMEFHWLTKGTPWVSVREGSNMPWNGLSISLRQMKNPTTETPDPPIPQIQYDISAYVEFKEFDYETSKQL
ncbi:capsid protein [Dipodfec virus UA04Rod_4537]|uniref:Capsid protein n=1 Tax=Dipodfec virus UA04Rod_4537 TaxID=2929250 RepID=A0A976N1Q1_9CIRC|nr:capsid protein [Dipodfec virus UA04Rod_4537]UPW41432.1 capsid protein [Dipodfec virus UA04Rod_4537]